jgi:hypothetical protein
LSPVSFAKDAFTPLEAQGPAIAVAEWLEAEGFTVSLESKIDGAPYRTTIRAKSGDLDFLVESQGTPDFSGGLRDLAAWLAVQRRNAQLYVAMEETDEVTVSGRMLGELGANGCGLLLVRGAAVVVMLEASNPALIVTPDPTLQYGHCKSAVKAAVEKFNRGQRKDGLRDLCELFEKETNALATKLARKGWIDKTEADVLAMDLHTKINVMASQDRYVGGRRPLVSDNLKNDLQSYRGARNLVDHPAISKREEIGRQRQFQDRMLMGPRLIAELVSLRRRIR